MNVFGGIKTGNPDVYYEPNSFDGPVEQPLAKEPPLRIHGDADRYNHRVGNDDYGQVRDLFNLFDEGEKSRLFANIAAAMSGILEEIAERQLARFDRVHPYYRNGVRRARQVHEGGGPDISVTPETPSRLNHGGGPALYPPARRSTKRPSLQKNGPGSCA